MKVPGYFVAFATAFTALSVGLVAMALHRSGGPELRSKLRRDQARVADLIAISSRINEDARGTLAATEWKPIPETIEGIRVDGWGAGGDRPVDPLTRRPYRYERLPDTRYLLCADFVLLSRDFERYGQKFPDDRWVYDPGEHCVEFKVDDARLNSWSYRY